MARLTHALVCAVLVLVAACGGSGNQITIATNPPGTNVYAVSAALAKLLQEETGHRSAIQPRSGSSVYLPMLHRGDVTLGLNTNIDGYLSFRGLPPYEAPMSNLRALGMMFPLNIAFMVRADSDLQSIEDLRGQRVVVTFRANVALEQLYRGILATGDLTFDDITPVTVAGVPEAVDALKEGRADAVPIGLGTALGLEANTSLPEGIRYLTLGTDEAQLPQIMPGTRAITIEPSASSIGIFGPIRVASVPDMLNTGAHLSDEDAYTIIKTIHTNWETLRAELAQLSGVAAGDIAPADNMHPYHPGAIRYFRETGLWTEAHEANQQLQLELANSNR